MKRSDIRAIFPDATDEQISQMLGAVHTEIDPLRDENDRLSGELEAVKQSNSKDAADWKKKAEDLEKELTDLQNAQTAKATKDSKRAVFEQFLKNTGLSDKGKEKVLKYTNLDDIELDDKGQLKNTEALEKSIAEEWSEYVTTSQTAGQNTSVKDGAGNSQSGKAMTVEEIFAKTENGRYKLSAEERQKAIMENPQLFE